MSIINDALKKVQQNRDHQKKDAGHNNLAGAPNHKKSPFNLYSIIILTSFLGSLVILGTFFFLSPEQRSLLLFAINREPISEAPSATPPLPSSLPVAQKDLPQDNQVSGLVLNGIVRMEKEYIALINNKIVKQGDMVGDKKILSIDKDQVSVLSNGETIVLKLNGI